MIDDTFKQKVFETFEYLHANPELSWQEKKTTNFIKQILEEAGCKVQVFADSTGVVGDLGNVSKDQLVVAIRADMDALWQEVDGYYQANHSCGHDAHMTIALGVLWKLMNEPSLREAIAVRFIFQPAEEVGTGAIKFIDKGIIEPVDYLFGIHLRPQDETPDGYAAPAIIHGSTGSIECEITGEDAHAAKPHLTNNAIEVGAHIIHALKAIRLNSYIPYSVKATKFHAGEKNANIIPGQATVTFDLRAQTNEQMFMLREKVYATLNATVQLYRSTIRINHDFMLPAAEINVEAQEIARQSIRKVLGTNYLTEPLITPGGDDFHFYSIRKPKLKATMIGLGCGLQPGLHHPSMTFNKERMIDGINILTEMIRIVAKNQRANRHSY